MNATFKLIVSSEFLGLLAKFLTVGGMGTAFDFLSTWILKEKLKLKKFTANSIGFTIGVIFRYIFNRIWTFESDNPNVAKEFAQFAIISLVGLGIVNAIVYLLHEKWGLSFYLAKALSMIGFFIWNFTANYLWTFAK